MNINYFRWGYRFECLDGENGIQRLNEEETELDELGDIRESQFSAGAKVMRKGELCWEMDKLSYIHWPLKWYATSENNALSAC